MDRVLRGNLGFIKVDVALLVYITNLKFENLFYLY